MTAKDLNMDYSKYDFIYIKHNSVILTAYDCKRRPEHGL